MNKNIAIICAANAPSAATLHKALNPSLYLKSGKLAPTPGKAAAKPKSKAGRKRIDIALNLTRGEQNAAKLLSALMGKWEARENRGTLTLVRFNKQWIAQSRDEWAEDAGLSEAQIKNSALPYLKAQCGAFLEVRSMKVSPASPKTLWMTLDLVMMQEALTDWDEYEFAKKAAKGTRKPTYPYKKGTSE